MKPISEARLRECYWLALFYHLNPNTFLDDPPSKIRQHMKYTVELHRLQLEALREEAQKRLLRSSKS
jgi:hypothetical protein